MLAIAEKIRYNIFDNFGENLAKPMDPDTEETPIRKSVFSKFF